ncbi:hypothetical protein RFI_22444, partial [Reticulomyxa filosa]
HFKTKKKEELRKMSLKSNAKIEKMKESNNEKSKEIQQLKDEIKQLKSEKELNEKKQKGRYFKNNIEIEKFKKDIQSKNQIIEDEHQIFSIFEGIIHSTLSISMCIEIQKVWQLLQFERGLKRSQEKKEKSM